MLTMVIKIWLRFAPATRIFGALEYKTIRNLLLMAAAGFQLVKLRRQVLPNGLRRLFGTAVLASLTPQGFSDGPGS